MGHEHFTTTSGSAMWKPFHLVIRAEKKRHQETPREFTEKGSRTLPGLFLHKKQNSAAFEVGFQKVTVWTLLLLCFVNFSQTSKSFVPSPEAEQLLSTISPFSIAKEVGLHPKGFTVFV